jgi:N-acetylglutamate synthase
MDQVIAGLERIAALHWRAPEEQRLGGWLLRAADGFTGRANSALPLGDPGIPLPDAVSATSSWYRERGLPPMITVPSPVSSTTPLDDFLAEAGWTLRAGPAFVMTAELAEIRRRQDLDEVSRGQHPPPPVRLDDEPDATWLTLFRGNPDLPTRPAALALLMSAPWQAFASIREAGGGPGGGDGGDGASAGDGDGDGAIMAVGRVSVAESWGAITAVEVAPAWRRRRLATAITAALCAAAAEHGAARILLQVETANAAAIALYSRFGFRTSHRYHYRVAPSVADPGLNPRTLRTSCTGQSAQIWIRRA